MSHPPIHKQMDHWRSRPNLLDYDEVRAGFSWEAIERELDGLPNDGGLNIAYEAVDRHVANGRGEHVAMRWIGKRDDRRELTYGDLAE